MKHKILLLLSLAAIYCSSLQAVLITWDSSTLILLSSNADVDTYTLDGSANSVGFRATFETGNAGGTLSPTITSNSIELALGTTTSGNQGPLALSIETIGTETFTVNNFDIRLDRTETTVLGTPFVQADEIVLTSDHSVDGVGIGLDVIGFDDKTVRVDDFFSNSRTGTVTLDSIVASSFSYNYQTATDISDGNYNLVASELSSIDVTVNPVPEPMTYAMLLVVGTLVYCCKRKDLLKRAKS